MKACLTAGHYRPAHKKSDTLDLTSASEFLTLPMTLMKLMVRPIAQMATRFGDLFDRMQKHCAFLQMLLHLRKAVFMAAARAQSQ